MRLAAVLSALALAGCGYNKLSPSWASADGVQTGPGGDGYPAVMSVTFVRSTTSDTDRTSACMVRGISGLESQPSVIGESVQASGAGSFPYSDGVMSMSLAFRYTLEVDGGRYQFTRIRHFNRNQEGSALSATTASRTEGAYSEMESVVDRIDACRR